MVNDLEQMMETVFVSKRTGIEVHAVPLVVGFSDRKKDMFRLHKADGSVTTVDRDSIRRRYTGVNRG